MRAGGGALSLIAWVDDDVSRHACRARYRGERWVHFLLPVLSQRSVAISSVTQRIPHVVQYATTRRLFRFFLLMITLPLPSGVSIPTSRMSGDGDSLASVGEAVNSMNEFQPGDASSRIA